MICGYSWQWWALNVGLPGVLSGLTSWWSWRAGREVGFLRGWREGRRQARDEILAAIEQGLPFFLERGSEPVLFAPKQKPDPQRAPGKEWN